MNTITQRIQQRLKLNRWLRAARQDRYQRLPLSDWLERDINIHGHRQPFSGGGKARHEGISEQMRPLLHRLAILFDLKGVAA